MNYVEEMLQNKKISDVLPFVYHDKKIRPLEEGVVSIAANTYQYGIGSFGGLRGFWVDGKVGILRLQDHHERLMNSARIFAFDYYIEFDEFRSIIQELLTKNKVNQGIYIRPFLHCDQLSIGPNKAPHTKFDLSIYMLNMGDYAAETLRLKSSSYTKFSDNNMSTKAKAIGGYLNSYLARMEAVQCGFNEALVFDNLGYVAEANVANVIISYHGRLITPPVASSALEGITLRTAVDLLRHTGHVIEEGNIDRSMVYTADELITTGTAMKVAYVTDVDGRKLGPVNKPYEEGGPIYKELKKAFNDLIAGKHSLSSKYMTYFNI